MEFTQETKTEREINLKMYAIDREINRIIGQLENNELSFCESWDLNDSIKHHEFMLRELQKQLDEHRNGLFKIFVIRDFKNECVGQTELKTAEKIHGDFIRTINYESKTIYLHPSTPYGR